MAASSRMIVCVVAALFVTAIQAQCTYKLEVKTRDVTFAGTDARVDIGVYDRSDRGILFQNLDGPGDDFERDQLDPFTKTAACLPNFCKLYVYLGPDLLDVGGWGLEYVNVTASGGLSRSVKFNYNGFISNGNSIYLNNC